MGGRAGLYRESGRSVYTLGMPEVDPLQSLRAKIDELDHRIVELLNARARIVVDIGKIKHQVGTPVYAPDREKVVLERIRQANKAVGGPLPNELRLEAIYRELMSGSFAAPRSRCGLPISGRRARFRIWRA